MEMSKIDSASVVARRLTAASAAALLAAIWCVPAGAAAGEVPSPPEDTAVVRPSAPITASVIGQTRLWTVSTPVAETDRDEIFQTERYGQAFSYIFSNVPPGPATLRLGFCENKWQQAGQRVFDIAVNGALIWPRFDILRHGMPNEAVVVSHEIVVPDDGHVEIAFKAYVDNAKINLIRLCGSNWVAETSPRQEQTVKFLQPKGDEAWLLNLYETSIGRFGSRFAINPRPQKGLIVGGPLGHADYNVAYFEKNPERYEDPPANYYFVLSCEDRSYGLPFNPHVPPFPFIKQSQGMTRLEYEASSPDIPVRLRVRFDAPFYPQDLKLSCAPYIWVTATVENVTKRRVSARLILGREQRPEDEVGAAKLSAWRGLCFSAPCFGIPTQWYWLVPTEVPTGLEVSFSSHLTGIHGPQHDSNFARDADGRLIVPVVWQRPIAGIEAKIELGPFEERQVRMLWVAWVQAPVVEVMHEPYRFIYTSLFRSPEEVVNFAIGRQHEIEERTALFESSVFDATLPPALKNLLAFAFQSWVMNTWYLCDAEGKEWFSVWEGCCKFHSTVDVEYNVAPLYFMYWPRLMALELREWSDRIESGILPHDMGMGLSANGMEYSHHMEVEENTNFVLLLHQYWKYTGDERLIRDLFERAAELLEHVTQCDTDGDGFVEQGTYNTIDQGSPAVQYAQDQVYLAVRSLAAYTAGAEMARIVGQNEQADRWRERATLIARTLDAQGWLSDHYVVALNQAQATAQLQPAQANAAGALENVAGARDAPQASVGVQTRGTADGPAPEEFTLGLDTPAGHPQTPLPADTMGGYEGRVAEPDRYTQPWAGYTVPSGPPKGWDAYSIYTTNGLLYPFRAGMRLSELRLERLRQDIGRAAAETLRMYGSPHTSEEGNMWVSQNIWRDAAAAYLGIDMIDNVDRYWAMQVFVNQKKRGCFTDVFNYGSGSISLDYYPRGVAAFALVYALGGVAIDVPARVVSVAALRTPLRIPLASLSDWPNKRLAWLVLERTGPDTRAKIEGPTTPEVRLETRPFGEPW